MGAMKAETPGRELIPASTVSGAAAGRRMRLAKALAATAKGRTSGTTNPPKRAGGNGKKPLKPGSRRYKLAAEDQARVAALKRRLEILGRRTRRGDLVAAGLLALAAMNDDQLLRTVATIAIAEPAGAQRQAT